MGERANAISEVTRFWLQARHLCLVSESLPVPVPYAQSDIDLLAVRGDLSVITLPDGKPIGPRIIIETKDEKDWEPKGKEFGTFLESDLLKMGDEIAIPEKTPCKFTMLRQEHFSVASRFFGTDDFDRLLVVHAMNPIVVDRYASFMLSRRIHVVTIREIVQDLRQWYTLHPRPAGLRHTLMGDIWHLLAGFCQVR